MAKLTAIMDDPEADTGHQLMAIRLLIGDDLASTIRCMEHDERGRAEAEQMTAADHAAVEGLLADWPAMTRETAEEFVADLHSAVTERLPKESLTEQLRRHLLGSPEPRLTAAEKDAVIREMYGKYGLDYELGPDQEPEPPPMPDPDREFLARRAIEDERARREQVKHPGQVPPAAPPAKVPALSSEQEAAETAERDQAERQRQEQARRLVWFGDLPIDPFGGL